MSNRSSTANAGQGGTQRRPRAYVSALVLVVMAWAGVPAARADQIILHNGESIEGSIVDGTRNTVIVRRAMGGMRQMPLQDIAKVRLDLAQGEQIGGELLGWVDGVHEVRSGRDIVRVSAGRILTRERRDQTTTPPPRLPRPLAPQPGKEPTVKAAGAAGNAPEVARAELTRARPGTAKVASARNRAAAVGATGTPGAQTSSVVAAPTPVGPIRIAATPGAVAPAGAAVAGADIAGVTPAKVSPAKVSKAAVAPAKVTASKTSPAAVSPAKASPAAPDIAKIAAAAGSGAEVANQPEAAREDQRLAVRGTVDPAAAGADGIVFRIELSRPAEQPVVLIYGTVDGTAMAGKDYEPQQGVVTLPAGSTSADVRVPLIEQPHPRNAGFELFLMADPKVAKVIDQRIAATIPAAN